MKCKSKLYYLFSVLLAFVLLLSPICTIGGRTEEIEPTPTSSPDNIFEYTEDYVRKNFNALCRYVVKQNAIISDSIIGSWNNFVTWLDSSGNGDIWTQHPHTPIRANGDAEVPEEVLQVINEYVVLQIQSNPLTYTQCTLSSYNFIDTSQFSNYNQYATFMQLCKNNPDTYCFVTRRKSGSNYLYHCAFVPKDYQVFFYGSTLEGIFSNVSTGYNWSSTSSIYNQVPNSVKVKINVDGSTVENASLELSTGTCHNGVSVGNSSTECTVFTTMPKNEWIYVFNNINAFRNFNSGQPQPYYITGDGTTTSMSNWQVGSGTINTGTLSNANSSYSSVVNNVQSGWTAEEVLELVDKISQNGGSGNGGSDNDSDDGWLDLGIFGDIGKAIAKVFGAIISAIATIFEEIISIVTNVSETLLQGVIFEFLSALLGWLPEEIIAVLTALFSIAVLFALIKLIREAF